MLTKVCQLMVKILDNSDVAIRRCWGKREGFERRDSAALSGARGSCYSTEGAPDALLESI